MKLKRERKINFSGLTWVMHGVLLPLKFPGNTKEYPIARVWHTHIYSCFLCVHLVTVLHRWPASLTNHIIWMNNETLFGGYFRGHTKTWRTRGMFTWTMVTSYTHINMRTQPHFLHTRAPLKKKEKNFSLRPWLLNNISVLCALLIRP